MSSCGYVNNYKSKTTCKQRSLVQQMWGDDTVEQPRSSKTSHKPYEWTKQQKLCILDSNAILVLYTMLYMGNGFHWA